MLTLIATADQIDANKIQIGDTIAGYYMDKYAFQAVVTVNRSGWMRQSGNDYFFSKYSVKLLADCVRPQNGLFQVGEEIVINLNGKLATTLIMHSR